MFLEVTIDDGRRIERRVLDAARLTIGRGPDCTLQLEGRLVSRHHATIGVSGQRMQVTDSSRNGTLAGTNWLRRGQVEVPMGTPLIIGGYIVSLVGGDSARRMEPVARESARVAEGVDAR
jgi:predicted component of type VI protein secretion system